MSPVPDSPRPSPAAFRTTHWSAVLLAGRDSLPAAQAALEDLCRTYWFPLYAFVRRQGRSHADAQDLVQGFFSQLLERRDLAGVHPDKGRFRTFLLSTLSHHLANEWHRARALKRGGGAQFVPLDIGESLGRYERAPADGGSPEAAYDRAWADQMLREVLNRLREECQREDGIDRFDVLKGCLLGERSAEPYTELARRLGTTESSVKSAIHRLRRRFREMFREEISRTVATEAEIEDELRHLVRVMAR